MYVSVAMRGEEKRQRRGQRRSDLSPYDVLLDAFMTDTPRRHLSLLSHSLVTLAKYQRLHHQEKISPSVHFRHTKNLVATGMKSRTSTLSKMMLLAVQEYHANASTVRET